MCALCVCVRKCYIKFFEYMAIAQALVHNLYTLWWPIRFYDKYSGCFVFRFFVTLSFLLSFFACSFLVRRLSWCLLCALFVMRFQHRREEKNTQRLFVLYSFFNNKAPHRPQLCNKFMYKYLLIWPQPKYFWNEVRKLNEKIHSNDYSIFFRHEKSAKSHFCFNTHSLIASQSTQ